MDFLQPHNIKKMSLKDELEIKRLGVHQPQDAVNQTAGKDNHRFNVQLFLFLQETTANCQLVVAAVENLTPVKMKPPKHDFFYVCVDEIEQIKLIGTDLSEANNCADGFSY